MPVKLILLVAWKWQADGMKNSVTLYKFILLYLLVRRLSYLNVIGSNCPLTITKLRNRFLFYKNIIGILLMFFQQADCGVTHHSSSGLY